MAGKKSSFQLLLSVLLISSVSLRVTKFIHYVGEEKTWQEARLYCQEEYIDLVSVWFKDKSEIPSTVRNLSEEVTAVWIGLNQDPSSIGEWSWTETSDDNKRLGFRHGGMDCAFVIPGNHAPTLNGSLCSELRWFYCSPDDKLFQPYGLVSWDSAQDICEIEHGKLSTVKQSNIDKFSKEAWVGLRRAPDGIWKWTGEPSDWESKLPKNADCGAFIVDTEEWLGYPCDDRHGFVCYSDNLILIKEEKTWEEALQHCRDLGEYDLLSSQYDHRFVRRHIEKAVTNEVWIGLHFLAGKWKWMDLETMEEQGLPHCAPKGKHCGIRYKYSSTLGIRDCMEKRNFICYKLTSEETYSTRPFPMPITPR